MHTHSVERWQHTHSFLGAKHDANQRRTLLVVALTAAMMVVEIIGGTIYGSMAVVADGWHMSTHAAALGIATLAYAFARRHATDRAYAFGTGKLGELAGFSSAIILALIALLIGYESVLRLMSPVAIGYEEALIIAVVGLGVNVLSAWILSDDGEHSHHEHHHHEHQHPGSHQAHHTHAHDHNLRAAYLHVLADAMTSVFAIVALLSARFFGWVWMDPAMGIVGACIIAVWSWGLVRSSAAVLLDMVPEPGLAATIRQRLERGSDRVADLHLWQLGPGHCGLIASIVSDDPQTPRTYKERLRGLAGLSHVTVEVHRCDTPALDADRARQR